MNVVYGMLHPDEGEILVDGQPVTIGSPREAMRNGIGMVFQHFMLIPVMTVAENLVLGDEPRSGGLLDTAARAAPDRGALRALRAEGRPRRARRGHLRGHAAARGDPARAGPRRARPRPRRADRRAHRAGDRGPHVVLAELKAGGTSIVFISHKLPEVLKVADRVTVLRRGKSVGTIDTAGADEPLLARMMVGRDVVLRVEKQECRPGSWSLEVTDLHVADDRGLPAVDGVTLQVRRGEIVALAGIDGNGQTEIVEAVTGLRQIGSGEVRVCGHAHHAARIRAGRAARASATSPRTATGAGSSSTST